MYLAPYLLMARLLLLVPLGSEVAGSGQLLLQQQQGQMRLLGQVTPAAGMQLWLQWYGQPAPWQLHMRHVALTMQSATLGHGCLGACPVPTCCFRLHKGNSRPRWSKAMQPIIGTLTSVQSSLTWWGGNWLLPLGRFMHAGQTWQLRTVQAVNWSLPPDWWWQSATPTSWRWQSHVELVQALSGNAWGSWLALQPQVPVAGSPLPSSWRWQAGVAGRWQWQRSWQWQGRLSVTQGSFWHWSLRQKLAWRLQRQRTLRASFAWRAGSRWQLGTGLQFGLGSGWQWQLDWRMAPRFVKAARSATNAYGHTVRVGLHWSQRSSWHFKIAHEQRWQSALATTWHQTSVRGRWQGRWFGVQLQGVAQLQQLRGQLALFARISALELGCRLRWHGQGEQLWSGGLSKQHTDWQWYGLWQW